MSWELNPVFFSPNGPVVSSPSPNLSQEEDATWTAICRSFPHSLAIAPAVEGVAKQSVLAAIRHRELEPFVEKYPDWPLALALQAEVHYLLNDTYGSCVMMERLKHIIEPAVDNAIDNAVKNLRGLLERPDEDQELPESSEDIVLKTYMRPATCHIAEHVQYDVSQTRTKWTELQEQITPTVAIERIARFAALTTNIFEGVFSIEGASWPVIVKRGFYANSIEGISKASRIKKKSKIVRILTNTESCFGDLTVAIQNPDNYDEHFIKTIHRKLLSGDNIQEEEWDDGTMCILIPRGEYRRVPCYASHASQGYEVCFCPWKQIGQEMAWYCQQARTLLATKSVNPFVACAWLQWAFLRIHPFADGNGRVGRIISSIPLIVAGLPPVVLSIENKLRYFTALDRVDESGDVHPLALFLQEEVETALRQLDGWNSVHLDCPQPVEVSRIPHGPSPESRTSNPSNSSSLQEAIDAASTYVE